MDTENMAETQDQTCDLRNQWRWGRSSAHCLASRSGQGAQGAQGEGLRRAAVRGVVRLRVGAGPGLTAA